MELEWPIPPHFELVIKPRHGDDGRESAVVETRDGRRIVGNVMRMDLQDALLEFQPERATANTVLGFSTFKSVRLTKPVELRRVLLDKVAGDSAPPSDKQKCVVNYKDGDSLISETIGFVPHHNGLFLFMVGYRNTVLRLFIPGDAMASYQIGDQLGKILVDEKIVTTEVLDAGLEKQEQLRSQKLGDYLQRNYIVTQQQVESALENQKKLPQLRLGDALIQENLITAEQLDNALKMQAKDRKMQLGDILVGMEAVKKETINRVLAQKLGIPFVLVSKFQFEPNLIKSVSAELVRKHHAMPLYRTESRMVVAMENPLSSEALRDLAFYTKLKIDPVMAPVDELDAVIQQFYGGLGERKDIAEFVSELGADGGGGAAIDPFANQVITDSDNTLVRLVNKIILDAFEQGASDIHIETMKGNKPTRVRFRKDGVMAHYSDIPANFRNALISRLKIMARLDISEKRQSQDGKLNFEQFGPARIELRVVTIPTTEGLEDIVMRILAAPRSVSLDGLGMTEHSLAALRKMALKPHGLVFVCGPTGSGKTTTLHSVLSFINTPERKIWTVEDPIEITQEGLRQVQVQARIDWTFATVLRSFLRADPDVIMVGETRDPETAKTVIEASLTGHLVFSTMHTNSAVESVVRLLDLGLDPFNFADALLGVVGQRLTRRLCTTCRKPFIADDEHLHMLAHEYCFETALDPVKTLADWREKYGQGGKITLQRAEGCPTCSNTGYRGRLGVYEVLTNTAAIKKKIHAKANVPDILNTAIGEGLRTMRQDGIEKIFEGHTDWEQIKAL